MVKRAAAVRHVHFEDLGLFEDVLSDAGYALTYHEGGADPIATIDSDAMDLLIVLGAPIGANDIQTYPFLADEIALIASRLRQRRPLFGICLGAQLMARAADAAVAPMGHKEVGFSGLTLTEAGRQSPMRHLENVPVLHWHGDSFAIPAGAVRLAATEACANQAFSLGRNAMGVQFHPEARIGRLEHWLIGHAAEIAAAGIDPRDLRRDAQRYGAELELAGRAFFAEWLAGLD